MLKEKIKTVKKLILIRLNNNYYFKSMTAFG